MRAVDAGVAAYAGNGAAGTAIGAVSYSRRYHGLCPFDELLVKRGDKVGRGQVIAKVGDTGGVSRAATAFRAAPRQESVDPREFLASAPSAGHGGKSDRGLK